MVKITLRDVIKKAFASRPDIQQDSKRYADNETRDKVLRTLRRQRRTQLEELEKEQLRKDIREFEKNRTARYIYGLKDKLRDNSENILSSGTSLKTKVHMRKKVLSSLKKNRKRDGFLLKGSMIRTPKKM